VFVIAKKETQTKATMRLFAFLLVGAVTTTVSAHRKHENKSHENNNNHHHDKYKQSLESADTTTTWEESFDTFVPYPPQALANELNPALSTVDLELIVNIQQNQQPLSALLKGIVARNHRVVASHHYFLQDAWVGQEATKTPCRLRRVVTEEPVTGDETWEPVPSKICQESCTNGGRYCLNSDGHQSGSEWVREVARRVCLEAVVSESTTQLWEYMEAFEQHGCRQAQNMTVCSFALLEQGMNHPEKITDCLAANGGLDVDETNDHLEKAVHNEIVDEVDNLPILEIDGRRYEERLEVEALLGAVCDAFPEDEPKPFACDYCGACADTRKCLWTLECNGEPLDAKSVFPVVEFDFDENDYQAIISWTILWSLVAILVMYTCKQFRTYRLMKEIEERTRRNMDDSLKARYVEKRTMSHESFAGDSDSDDYDESDNQKRFSIDSSSSSHNSTPRFGEMDAPLESLV
jgi:hypothetical protein